MRRATRCAGWVVAVVLLGGVATATADGASNLLVNGGFESPPGGRLPEAWAYYTSNVEGGGLATNAASGLQSARLSVQGIAGTFQGFYQVLPAVPGARYRIKARACSDPACPLDTNAYVQLVVEWKDWAGMEITRYWSTSFDGSRLRRRSWQTLDMLSITAPGDAAEGLFGVHLFDGEMNARGAVLVDDVQVTRIP